MRGALPLAVLLSFAWTCGATLEIPSAAGPLTIDGNVDEPIWQTASLMAFPVERAGPFPVGGETRIMVRQGYLCLSAVLPESDRVVAGSTGRDLAWWAEDLIVWRFRVHPGRGQNVTVSLAVNPLGAFRWEGSPSADGVLAAARLGSGQWRVEAAIPLRMLALIDFGTVERVRPARPNTPELHWYWPEANNPFAFTIPTAAVKDAVSKPLLGPQPTDRMASVAPFVGSALSSLPGIVWSGEELKWMQGALQRSLRARMADAADRERLEWERVRAREDWERFRDSRIAALRSSLGAFPERTPLRAEVTRRADAGDGVVIENLIFESRPGLLVTANLYLPSRILRQIPGMVSHHAPKTQVELQDIGMTYARAGSAVLVMDQLGAGERPQSQPWPRESYYSRYALGMQLDLAGESLMKWMVWDLMRSIDLLLERDYVDPRRIVVIGAVAGGGDPAAVAAALDNRIAAVAPFNFGEAGPEEHYLEGPRGYDFQTAWPGLGDWETTRSLRHSVVDQFFPWLICAAMAPRGFLYSFELAWPKTVEEQPAWERYKAVFDWYGARDRLAEVHGFGPYPGPGECTNVAALHRKQIYPVLKRWLNIPEPLQEFHNPRPDAELMCLTPGIAATRGLRTASEIALEIARQRLRAARAGRSDLSPEERLRQLRSALQAKLGDIEPSRAAAARRVWSRAGSDFLATGLALETDSGISIPLLLLKPKATGRTRLPVVMAIAQQGNLNFLSQRGDEIARLLSGGAAVCLMEPRGSGETAPSARRDANVMMLAAVEQMLGDTLLGARVKDARTAFRYLSQRVDIDPQRVALWGDSFAVANPRDVLDLSPGQVQGAKAPQQAEPLGQLAVLLTALYEENIRAVATRRGLISFLSVLRDRFCYVPRDVIVPGILEAGDVADVVGALAPRSVLLEGLVDGRNRLLEPPEWDQDLETAIEANRAAQGRLVVRRSSADLAQWLLTAIGTDPRER
jgi:hypothetical protein